MSKKQTWHLPLSLAAILLLYALFSAAGAALDVSAQTIPTITPTPNPSNPTATSQPANPTATSAPANPTATSQPANPTATSRPANPTATSQPANPTATGMSASATPSRTPTASATPGPGTPSATPRAGTAVPSLTPSTDATTNAGGASARDGNDGLESETEPGLATASPIPDRPDDAEATEDGVGDDTGAPAPLPGEGTDEGSSLIWLLLLGAGLVIAAGVLFFLGRRTE